MEWWNDHAHRAHSVGHAKPVVLADRRRAQTDPAGRLEKCGLEISLKVGHLAYDNLEN